MHNLNNIRCSGRVYYTLLIIADGSLRSALLCHTGHRVVISYYTFMRFVMKVSITIFIAIILCVSSGVSFDLLFR